MPYFEGLDKFGFFEDPLMGDSSTFVRDHFDLVERTDGGWLMGGPNTGFDDAAGVAVFGLGLAMLNPIPPVGYLAWGAVGVRLGLAASTGMVAYGVASLAMMAAGWGLTKLD